MNTTPKYLDKYELLERLDHSGIAEVWKALDIQLRRNVAIKLLRPDLRNDPKFLLRFQREAQLSASLHHPNIIQVHDFQVYRLADQAMTPIAYMVMDYVEGETLADYIARTSGQGHIPSPEEIFNLFASLSQAIDYAHQHGMIHRDMKPTNILLDRRNTQLHPMGEPLLTDFGVARLLGASGNVRSEAQSGTPFYISPEQASGHPGDERSDIYSLGIILYEIVTGVTPFRGDTPQDVITQHLQVTPTLPTLINPHISPALTQVIMRSLAKDPATRYPSASSLAAALAEALNIPVPGKLPRLSYPSEAGFSPTQTNQPATLRAAGGPNTPLPIAQPTMSAWPAAPSPRPAAHTVSPPNPPTQIAQPPTKGRKKYRGRNIFVLAVLALVLLSGAGIGAYALLPGNPIIGQAFYISSGQIAPQSAQGIADQLQLDLKNVPDPATGQSYYVWLLPDRKPEPSPDLTGPRPVQAPILLTNHLLVHNGEVHYLFKGDAQHNNLLSATSRLLITEESGGQTPTRPTQDRATWRYYGEIPQAQIPGADAGFTALVHIRHLFYDETNIRLLGLKGGLDIWLFRNTEKIVEWATSARDYWNGDQTTSTNIQLMDNQFIRILDYLDGCSHANVDLPYGTQPLTDTYSCKVALLTVDPTQGTTEDNPPGYMAHTTLHVKQISTAPDITPEMRQHTQNVISALSNAEMWLRQVRTDATKLAQMNNNPDLIDQATTGSLLDEMVTSALYAYLGKLDSVTNQIQPAVLQAHYEIQQLATLNISKELPQTI